MVSLKGTYTLDVSGVYSTIKNCSIDDKNIAFVGCNSVSMQYDAHNDGYFKVISAAELTRKFCTPSYDGQIISVIKSA